MKTVTLKLDEELHARLTEAARRRGCTKSELIRDAVQGWLQDRGTVPHGSLLELAQDLVGCVDGAEDLSTNSEHMRDFGR